MKYVSHSELTKHQQCERRWWTEYKLKQWGKRNYRMVLGSAIGEIFGSILRTNSSAMAWLSTLPILVDSIIRQEGDRIDDPNEVRDMMQWTLDRLMTARALADIDAVLQSIPRPVKVEAEEQFPLGDVILTKQSDIEDANGTIWEFKVHFERRPTFEAFDRQMCQYAIVKNKGELKDTVVHKVHITLYEEAGKAHPLVLVEQEGGPAGKVITADMQRFFLTHILLPNARRMTTVSEAELTITPGYWCADCPIRQQCIAQFEQSED